MAISHCYWHLVVKNGNFTLLQTSSGQEWQFPMANGPPKWIKNRWLQYCYTKLGRQTFFGQWTCNWYWHLVVKMCSNLVRYTPRSAGRSTCQQYWHLVVKNGNFTFLLTSSSQQMQFHIYWYVVVKNGNFTLLLTSSGQEWQFHIATDI